MKRIYLIAVITLIIVLGLNVVLYYKNYNDTVRFQKNLLDKQLSACDSIIRKNTESFLNDLNRILYSYDVIEIFNSDIGKENGMRKLELFYSSYTDLINNINVYDNNKNVLSLSKNEKNDFIPDFFIAQRQRKLANTENTKVTNNFFQYCIPIF